MKRVAIFAGVLLHYAIVGVLLAYGAPLERLDAPVEWNMATFEIAGPPEPASHDVYTVNDGPRYREHAREIIGCSVPNPWSRRIAGEACVYPSEDDRRAMERDGVAHAAGTLKVCVSATGAIASVTRLRSTKYDDYDQRLLAAVRDWQFQPYLVDGQPRAVCSTVTFVYTIK